MESDNRRKVVVDLSELRLEGHVGRALDHAWRLTGGKPLGSADLLTAVVLEADNSSSEAFREITSLLPLGDDSGVAEVSAPEPNLATMPFTPALGRSLEVAKRFLAKPGTVWGRDLVTLALLADDEPELEDLADQAGTSLAALRVSWLQFVSSSDIHRSPEDWADWWREAGVPAAAFLLTWNPERFDPEGNEFRGKMDAFSLGEEPHWEWSTGVRKKNVPVGDRVFLLRQGRGPRGIVGVGIVVRGVEMHGYQRREKRGLGEEIPMVDVRWQALSPEPFIPLERLDRITGVENDLFWRPRGSGVEIPHESWQVLESIWERAWGQVAPKGKIARLDADTGPAIDSLGIERHVRAFARVIASRALEPPLSIGLFGDWGVGKTFFMQRLHDQVAEQAQRNGAASTLFWPRICQIQFNAWHYTETNLWASLVSRIFERLRQYMAGRGEDEEVGSADEREERFNRLLNQLELTGELRREAEVRHESALQKLQAARSRLGTAESKLKKSLESPIPQPREMRAILSESALESELASAGKLVKLLRKAEELTGNPRLVEVADDIEDGKSSVDEVRELLQEARSLGSRARFWWRILRNARLHRSAGFWGLLLLVAAVAVVVLHIGGEEAGLWAVSIETLAVVGVVVGWMRSRISQAARVFSRLDKLQIVVERRLAEKFASDQLDYERNRDKAEREEQEAREEVAASRDEFEAACKEEETARAAVRDSTSRARLGQFVLSRVESGDYEKYLGLVAMVHRDFRKLSKILKEGLLEQEQGVPEQVEGLTRDLPRIDRIVLYIDDLDRCYPPEKVVRVLEAVHLLLSFPLFVVVVGVDSRWLAQSLKGHYVKMFNDVPSTSAPGVGSLNRAPAGSHDFLEKIFQVPFWLQRMEPPAIRLLVDRLVTEDERAASKVEPGGEESAGNDPDSSREDPVGPKPAPRVGPEPQGPEVGESRQQDSEGEPSPAEGLLITRPELEFMRDLAPLMPRTPRAVKRFVNIYRLYKAALSSSALRAFLGTREEPGQYRAVQILLALVTGAPAFAKTVVDGLEGLEKSRLGHLSDFVRQLDERAQAKWPELEMLRQFAQGTNDLELQALREVSPDVCRYSVHHMVGDMRTTSQGVRDGDAGGASGVE